MHSDSRQDVTIPHDLAPGFYLLRGELLALHEADQRPGRWQLQHAGDAAPGERGHAPVPPDRPGDLRDQQPQAFGAGSISR